LYAEFIGDIFFNPVIIPQSSNPVKSWLKPKVLISARAAALKHLNGWANALPAGNGTLLWKK